MTRAFLSHSRTDKRAVLQIAAEFERHEIETWIDDRKLTPGEPLGSHIERAIERADYFLLFLSEESLLSTWVQKEMEVALSLRARGGKPKVIPILLQKVALPEELSGIFYADLCEGEGRNARIQQLISAMGGGVLVSPSLDNLEDFHIIDMLVDDGKIYMLLRIRSGDDCVTNPDGQRRYESDTFIAKISYPPSVNSIRIARRMYIAEGCINIRDGYIDAYLNYKMKHHENTYYASGCKYTVTKSPLAIKLCDPIFSDENCGWHPRVEAGIFVHFKFSGHHLMHDMTDMGRYDGEESWKEHLKFVSGHSAGIFYHSQHYAWQKVRDFLTTGVLSRGDVDI